MTKNWKELQLKKMWYFFIKNCNFSSLSLHKGCLRYRRAFSPQKRTSSSNSKNQISYFFLFFCFIFCPPRSGSGSTDLVESGSNPDPKHWYSNIIVWMQVHVSLPGYEVQEVEDMVAFLYGRLRADSLPLALCQHLQLGCFRYLVSASTSSWGALGIWSLPAPPAGVL